jgi:hypothetical protein
VNAAHLHWLVDAVLVALVVIRTRTIVRLEALLVATDSRHKTAAGRVASLEAWRSEVEGDPRRFVDVDRADRAVPELTEPSW